MREKRGSLTYYEFQLPFNNDTQELVNKRPGSWSRVQSRCNSRNTFRPNANSPSRPCSRQSHSCVNISQDTNNQNSQHILVGSALRRPHATEYSPLDYQSMPDVGKIPRQPYRSQSSCTVYTYADRPVSASEQSSHLGRHTKSSLLRCKSASSASLYSASSTSTMNSASSLKSSSSKKRLCEVRDDYRFFKSGPVPKQVPPHGESLHGFLTGARYNRARYLDSRALSKLGVYIPKPDLNSFFIRDEFDDSDARSIFSDCLEEELLGLEDKDEDDNDDEERTFCSRASNTEPHYLSIKHWHSAEWKTDRKPSREQRVQSAPLKVKAIKAYYHDYSKK